MSNETDVKKKNNDKLDVQCRDIVDRATDWGKENPKTAVAVGAVGIMTTAYCGYKMVKKLMS